MPVAISDVEVMLGRALTAAEQTRATRLLAMAEAAVESALPGFTFDSGTETVTIQSDDPGFIWTPKYPVSNVGEIQLDDEVIDADYYRWNELGKITAHNHWPLNDYEVNLRFWGATTRAADITITYSYGGTVPEDMAAMVASMVATTIRRQAVNPDNVQSEALGAYQVSFGDAEQRATSGGIVAPDTLPKRWRRLRQVSVPLVRP